MNAIFGIILVITMTLMLFVSPEEVLSAFISGGEKALALAVQMTVVYAVWLGVLNVFEKTGLSGKCAKILKPANKFLFGTLPEKANDYVSLNISANMLGMSGATTPMGIKAVREMEKYKGTEYAIAMFFVINATSVQLIPSSVLALRIKFGASAASDIILPTILATLLSSVIGVLLVKLFIKKKS
ncbi:MAG: hypothetical protein J5911_03425 [Clostridia bacterium]|nr:hypothetical protein [Clostridia bacterium]